MDLLALCAVLSRTDYAPAVPAIRAAGAGAIPFRVQLADGTVLQIRASEAGQAEAFLEEEGVAQLVATERGTVKVSRWSAANRTRRPVRIPDLEWGELCKHGRPNQVLLAAIRAYLASHPLPEGE
jgi:hypothetical protein